MLDCHLHFHVSVATASLYEMPRGRGTTTSASVAAVTSTGSSKEAPLDEQKKKEGGTQRSGYLLLALFVLLMNGSWAVYHYQYESLPSPLNAEQAGKRGFSEVSAMSHVKHLAELGPHPLGSIALDRALQVHVFFFLFNFFGFLSQFPLLLSILTRC